MTDLIFSWASPQTVVDRKAKCMLGQKASICALLVEGDPLLREALSDTIAESGFRVVEKQSHADAEDWLSSTATSPHVIVASLEKDQADIRLVSELSEKAGTRGKIPLIFFSPYPVYDLQLSRDCPLFVLCLPSDIDKMMRLLEAVANSDK